MSFPLRLQQQPYARLELPTSSEIEYVLSRASSKACQTTKSVATELRAAVRRFHKRSTNRVAKRRALRIHKFIGETSEDTTFTDNFDAESEDGSLVEDSSSSRSDIFNDNASTITSGTDTTFGEAKSAKEKRLRIARSKRGLGKWKYRKSTQTKELVVDDFTREFKAALRLQFGTLKNTPANVEVVRRAASRHEMLGRFTRNDQKLRAVNKAVVHFFTLTGDDMVLAHLLNTTVEKRQTQYHDLFRGK